MFTLENASKIYANGHRALADIDLGVERGEVVALVGGSGCGKSTLLRLVAGLERPSTGRVTVAGHPIDGPHADVGVVFQEPRLMPWLTVEENVRFGLGGQPVATQRELAGLAIRRVGLDRFRSSLPRQLSGGMAQRAALARALVTRPPVLLLDEPFSALDAFTRADLQDHLLELWSYDQPTLLVVTHDIDEALLLADRVMVMAGQPGRIVAEVSVGQPRPRDRSSTAFARTRAQVLDVLRSVRAPSVGMTQAERVERASALAPQASPA